MEYLDMEFKEWDKSFPLMLYGGQVIFFNINEIKNYLKFNDLKLSDLDFVLTEPFTHTQSIDIDFFEDSLPLDYDFEIEDIASGRLTKAVHELNKAIQEEKPWVYGESNYRTEIKL
jgi:hypothetical protein